jgi:hypothetical protein
MALYQESGYNGVLFGLSGLVGKLSRGRQAETSTVAVDNAKVYQILGSNLNRLAVLICNQSNQTIYLSLGDLAAQTIVIYDKGSFQIDKDFPWTGFIYCLGSSGTPGNVSLQEISIP